MNRSLRFSCVVGALLAMACSESGPEPVVAVTLSAPSVVLESGGETQIVATPEGKGGKPLEGRRVAWRSADESIATVDSTGRLRAAFVTGANDRSTTVTATAGGQSSTVEVRVLPSPVAAVLLGPALDLAHGATQQLLPGLRDSRSNTLTGRQVTYLSRDTTVARVSSTGLVTTAGFLGGSNRTTYVLAFAEGARDSVSVSVAPTTVASVAVTPGEAYLAPGSTRRLRARALSPAGIAISGVPVDWTTSDASVVTVNSLGVVSAAVEGSAFISATAGGQSRSALITVNTCGAAPAGDYPIEVRFLTGVPNAGVTQAFTCAAARIRAVIRAPLPPIFFANLNANACAEGQTLNESVPGLLIFASVVPIDGVGRVLGSAGPCYTRLDGGLTAVGRMRFDVEDILNIQNAGTLGAVIMHEMLHVIGIGTLWAGQGLLEGVGTNPRFNGGLARAACINDIGGTSQCQDGVPVEDCVGIPGCGSGTINSHWREATFDNELMTGYLDSGFNPFSRMSIQSLADLGYGVDVGQADDYTLLPPASAMLRSAGVRGLQMPAPTMPIARVDRRGRVVQ